MIPQLLLLHKLNHLYVISLHTFFFFFTVTGCLLCMFSGMRVKEIFFLNYMTDYDKRQNSFALSYLISFNQFSFCPSKEVQTANKMSVLIKYSTDVLIKLFSEIRCF